MDKDLEKSLQDLIRKSHQLARQSGELAAKYSQGYLKS